MRDKNFPGGPATMMASFRGKLFAGCRDGLLMSSDFGQNWKLVPDAGLDTVSVDVLAENGAFLIAQKRTWREFSLAISSDGITWKPFAPSRKVRPEHLETHGKFIVTRFCDYAVNDGERNICRNKNLSVLDGDGKKFVDAKMSGRCFWFDGDDIYTINISYPEKHKQAGYVRTFYKSGDGCKKWAEVDTAEDNFVRNDPNVRAKLEEFDSYKEADIAEQNMWIASAAIAWAHAQERKMERRPNSRGYVPSGPVMQSSSGGPDYRALSNDRFKERYNHTDSWIDSHGQIHTN